MNLICQCCNRVFSYKNNHGRGISFFYLAAGNDRKQIMTLVIILHWNYAILRIQQLTFGPSALMLLLYAKKGIIPVQNNHRSHYLYNKSTEVGKYQMITERSEVYHLIFSYRSRFINEQNLDINREPFLLAFITKYVGIDGPYTPPCVGYAGRSSTIRPHKLIAHLSRHPGRSNQLAFGSHMNYVWQSRELPRRITVTGHGNTILHVVVSVIAI